MDSRSEWELFYAAPSLSAPAFFAAMAEQAPALDGSGADAGGSDPTRLSSQSTFAAAQALDQLAELARAVQVTLECGDYNIGPQFASCVRGF